MGHQSLTSGMELKDNILVSGNADSTVKIWDIKSGDCLKTLEGEKCYLTFCNLFSLIFQDSVIIFTSGWFFSNIFELIVVCFI